MTLPNPNIEPPPGAVLTAAEIAAVFAQIQENFDDLEASQVGGRSVPAGTILATGRSTAAPGYAMCDGGESNRTGEESLFTAIGTKYGVGNGTTTFNRPDLRGRVPVGVDGTAGRLSANDELGKSAGEEKHTLSSTEIPTGVYTPQQVIPENANFGWGGAPSFNAVSGWAPYGGGTAHNNMQPYQIVNFMIKL